MKKSCEIARMDFDRKCEKLGGEASGSEGKKKCNLKGSDKIENVRRMDLVFDAGYNKVVAYHAWAVDPYVGYRGMLKPIETNKESFDAWMVDEDVYTMYTTINARTGKTEIERGMVKGIPMLGMVRDDVPNYVISFLPTKSEKALIAMKNDRAENAMLKLEPVHEWMEKNGTEIMKKQIKDVLRELGKVESFRTRNENELINMEEFRKKHLDLPDARVEDAKINFKFAKEFLGYYENDTPEEIIKSRGDVDTVKEAMDAIKKARKTIQESQDILIEAGVFV